MTYTDQPRDLHLAERPARTSRPLGDRNRSTSCFALDIGWSLLTVAYTVGYFQTMNLTVALHSFYLSLSAQSKSLSCLLKIYTARMASKLAEEKPKRLTLSMSLPYFRFHFISLDSSTCPRHSPTTDTLARFVLLNFSSGSPQNPQMLSQMRQ